MVKDKENVPQHSYVEKSQLSHDALPQTSSDQPAGRCIQYLPFEMVVPW